MDVVDAQLDPNGDIYIYTLAAGIKWGGTALTYSFPAYAVLFTGYGPDEEPSRNFEQLNSAQQAAVKAAFTALSSFTNLTFTELTGSDASSATLRFGMSDEPTTAYAFYPNPGEKGGDSWYNNSGGRFDNPVRGNYAYLAFFHEIGHSLGLDHPHESIPPMPLDRDYMAWTVMSYRSSAGGQVTGFTNETWGFAQTYMAVDIITLQALYGANYSSKSGDTVYSWSPTTGEEFIDGVGQGAPGSNRVFMTVWDGGGSDTYDFSNYPANSTGLIIDLRPGGWTTLPGQLVNTGGQAPPGNIANAFLHQNDTRSLIENVNGSPSADTIYGNDAANVINGGGGNDLIYGYRGDDRLVSGSGSDRLDGGDGNDGLFFGADYDATDIADGGPGTDTLAIQGNYQALTLGDVRNVEVLLALSGSDTRFGDTANSRYDYTITTNDGNVAAGQILTISATGLLPGEDLRFDGSAESDGGFRVFAGQGNDTLIGGSGSDGFFFGADGNLTSADRISGGAGIDSIAMRGNYSGAGAVQFSDASFSGIEVLVALSGHTNEYGGPIVANGFDYDVSMVDGNVAAGQLLQVNATTLRADESLRFDGRAELNGTFRILSGAGDDTLYGGAGNDMLYGGLGADHLIGGGGDDTFVYRSVLDSTSTAKDTISGFQSGDRIDLSYIDAIAGTPENEAFSFIGSGAFTSHAGELRVFDQGGGNWLVQGDIDGDGTADLWIVVQTTNGHQLGIGDFGF